MNGIRAVAFIGVALLLLVGLFVARTDGPRDAESDDPRASAAMIPSGEPVASGMEAAAQAPQTVFPPPASSRSAELGAAVSAPLPLSSAPPAEPAERTLPPPDADERPCVFVSEEAWARYLDAVRKATREGDWDPLLALPGDMLGSRLCDAQGRSFEPFAVTFPRMPRELIERLLARGFMVAPRHLPRAASAGREILELFIGTGVSYEEPAIRDGMIRAFILKNDVDGLAYLSALGIDLSDPLGEKRWLDMALQLSRNTGQAESLAMPEFLRRHGAVKGPSEFETASAEATPPGTGP